MFYKDLLKRMNELMERVYHIGAEIAIWEDERKFGNDPVKLYSTTATTYEHITKWLEDMERMDMETAKYEVQNRNNKEDSDYEKTYQILSYVLTPLRDALTRTKKKIELFMLEHETK